MLKKYRRKISKKRIKKLREKLNLTQAEFARILGKQHGVISKWESGSLEPQQYSCSLIQEMERAATYPSFCEIIKFSLYQGGAIYALYLALHHANRLSIEVGGVVNE